MRYLRKPTSTSLIFIPASLVLAGITAVAIEWVDRGSSPLADAESREQLAEVKAGINREVARSLETPQAPAAAKAPIRDTATPPPPSRPVKAILEVKPEYPRLARQLRMQGPVDVVLQVDPSGVPVSGEIVNGNPAFSEDALKASLGWRFLPALQRGRPVASAFTIHFNFRLDRSA